MRNDCFGEAWAPADVVSYELVVFERHGDEVELTVRGMTSSLDLDVVCHDRGRGTEVTVVGAPSLSDLRPYEVRTTVELRGDHPIAVRGLHETESLLGGSLPEAMPVVCGADPAQAGVVGDFLHRRGDRYVLMSGGSGAARDRYQFTQVA